MTRERRKLVTPTFHVPERFLRQLWKHLQFDTSKLQTTDSRQVEILSPGKLNTDGGPDFANARIRIGGIVYRGNVELHQNDKEWTQHAHQLDAKYNSVILHVVFRKNIRQKNGGQGSDNLTTTKSKRNIPVLILEPYLTSSYRTLWEKMILDERSERLATIKCFSVNDSVEGTLIQSWLKKLAVERIELKVRRFEERLKELVDEQKPFVVNEPPSRYDEIPFGINPEDLPPPITTYDQRDFGKISLWNQLLFEGVMEALGYSKNQQPFIKIAQNLRLELIRELLNSPMPMECVKDIEAMLFGVAGMLSPSLKSNDAVSKSYMKKLGASWKNFRHMYHRVILHEAEWQFFRMRPDNFPTVRIAGVARMIPQLLQKDFFKSVIQTAKSQEFSANRKVRQLQSLFIVHTDGYWQHHYLFGEIAKQTVTTLIGKSRADDIVLNVVIPICLLYARIFKDKEVRHGALEIFEECPGLSDNTITRIIEKQLIKQKFKLDSAMLQQGALQLYKFYCVEERCKECAIGKEVF